MTAKEFYKRPFDLNKKVVTKAERVAALRATTQRITASMDGEPVSHTRNMTAMQDAVIRLMEVEDELNQLTNEYLAAISEVSAEIQNLPGERDKLIMEMRYLAFTGWDEIAESMGLSRRYVLKIHGFALSETEKRLKRCSKVSE